MPKLPQTASCDFSIKADRLYALSALFASVCSAWFVGMAFSCLKLVADEVALLRMLGR
jgi:hypothetical protein